MQHRNDMNGTTMMNEFISEACTGGGRHSRAGKTKTSFLVVAVGVDWCRRHPVEPRVIGKEASKGDGACWIEVHLLLDLIVR